MPRRRQRWKATRALEITEGPAVDELGRFGGGKVNQKLLQRHKEEIHDDARENQCGGRHPFEPSEKKNEKADHKSRNKGRSDGTGPELAEKRESSGDRDGGSETCARSDPERRGARKRIGRNRLNGKTGQ